MASGSRKPVVALEWDARSLRVAYAVWQKKRIEIRKAFSVPIPAEVDRQDASQLGAFIRSQLAEQDVHVRRAIVDIARDQAILTTLKLPGNVPDELPNMVQFQIAKDLPFAVAEAAVDFAVPSGELDDKLVPVSVAAVRSEYVEHARAVCAAAGLRLERIGLRPFANRLAVCRMLGDTMPPAVLFIDVGPALMEVDVLTPTTLSFSRAASVMVPRNLGGEASLRIIGSGRDADSGDLRPGGDTPVISAERVVDGLILEVMRSVEAFRTTAAGVNITHAIVSGDVGVEEALQEELQKRFGYNVELYNPASTFHWTPDEGAAAIGFPAVLGLILGEETERNQHFDFLHPKQAVSQTTAQLRKAPRVVGWAAFIGIALGVLYWANFSDKQERVAELTKAIDDLSDRKREKEEFIKLVSSIREFDRNEDRVWLDDIWHLVMALPEGEEKIVLDRLDADDKNDRIVIKTRAKDGQVGPHIVELLGSYRREGAKLPLFDAEPGSVKQSGTPTGRYPIAQDYYVDLRRDGYKPPAPEPAPGAAGAEAPAVETTEPSVAPGEPPVDASLITPEDGTEAAPVVDESAQDRKPGGDGVAEQPAEPAEADSGDGADGTTSEPKRLLPGRTAIPRPVTSRQASGGSSEPASGGPAGESGSPTPEGQPEPAKKLPVRGPSPAPPRPTADPAAEPEKPASTGGASTDPAGNQAPS